MARKATFKAYRNLHKDGFFSISHKNKVVDYAEVMVMEGCRFHVNENGRLRTVERRRKGVHAYVVGDEYKKDIGDIDLSQYEEVWYSPYFCQSFMGIKSGKVYETADKVVFMNNKCYCKLEEEAC